MAFQSIGAAQLSGKPLGETIHDPRNTLMKQIQINPENTNPPHSQSNLDSASYIFWYAEWAVRRRRIFDKRWRIPKRCTINPVSLVFETLPSLAIEEIAATSIKVHTIHRVGTFADVIIQFHRIHPVFGRQCTLDIFPTTGGKPEQEARAFVQVVEAFRQGLQPSVDPHPWRRSYRANHRLAPESALEPIDQPPYNHEPADNGWIVLGVLALFTVMLILSVYFR